jgi:hypothetical protein
MLPTHLDYRGVVRDARTAQTPGLLRSAFPIENPTTCFQRAPNQRIPAYVFHDDCVYSCIFAVVDIVDSARTPIILLNAAFALRSEKIMSSDLSTSFYLSCGALWLLIMLHSLSGVRKEGWKSGSLAVGEKDANTNQIATVER